MHPAAVVLQAEWKFQLNAIQIKSPAIYMDSRGRHKQYALIYLNNLKKKRKTKNGKTNNVR